MIRRALIAAILAGFVFGVFSSEAGAATWIRHNSRIVILQEGFPIEGDIRSAHYDCTRSRLVGLFQNGVQVDRDRSNANGRFTLTPPGPGTYDVIAFRHAIVCPHLCPLREVQVTIESNPV
jgi:hypothetical protein